MMEKIQKSDKNAKFGTMKPDAAGMSSAETSSVGLPSPDIPSANTASADTISDDAGAIGNLPDTNSVNERGGPKGPEPTRFGDWESNGRCTDF